MQLTESRHFLLNALIRDWDGETPFPSHCHNWQSDVDQNPFKYQLIASTLGNYRKTTVPYVPLSSLIRWATKLNIELPKFHTHIHLATSRHALLTEITRDWDGITPFADHCHNWQQDPDPQRYQLLADALGGYRRSAQPYVSIRNIRMWATKLSIELPEFRASDLHLPAPRYSLIHTLIKDWDGVSPFHIHTHNWQQDPDPQRYQLLADALGGYRRSAQPYVPFRTLKAWAKKLNIQLPHPFTNLVKEWDRSIPFHIHARQRHPDVPYQNIRNWVIRHYGTYPPPSSGPD